MRFCGAVLLGLFLAISLRGQEPPRKVPSSSGSVEVPAPEESVRKVGEARYVLGGIEFDARSREIRLPVRVNMREGGPVEYLLVREDGKVHESVFTTSVSPLHLQIAMKLLRYKAGHGDVFNRFLPPDRVEVEGGKAADRGESVELVFEAEGGTTLPAHELVMDGVTRAAMGPGPWVHTGSTVEEGAFMAEVEGSIVAIYLDPLALFNMTREGADIDERWGAHAAALPALGSRGFLLIRPVAGKGGRP